MKRFALRLLHRGPLLIVLGYLAAGILWILFSDSLVMRLIDDPQMVARVQTIKGWFYVFVTALLLYLFIARDASLREREKSEIKKLLAEQKELTREVHHRVGNNLQLINSLLSLETAEVQGREARSVVERAQKRIEAMALVHHRSFTDGKSRPINPASLTEGIISLHPDLHWQTSWESSPRPLPLEKALCFALILSHMASLSGLSEISVRGEADKREAGKGGAERVKPEDRVTLTLIFQEQRGIQDADFLEIPEALARQSGRGWQVKSEAERIECSWFT